MIQETRNLITNAIEQMLQIMESTMHQIEANATVTGQRIQAILDNISHSQNTQNRETIRDTTRTSQNIINTSQRTSDRITENSRQANRNIDNSTRTSDRITENSRQANRNIDNSTRTTSNRLLSTANGIVQRIRNRIRSASEQTREQVSGTVNHLENTFNGLKSKIIATFSTVAIISFGKQCIEASASVNALNSQIEQTFGSLKNQAEKAMQTVATESGIVETRLQSVGTSIYAFAKTSGMDSASALNMMQEALQVTADSAAYYDRSLEETAESLKSFLKGNYANDAALGISCTETTRNTAANKLYGKSFQELSEAQKQLTLLQMVKDANQLSGAMGQASREADGWENVIGNLKEAWKQFLAVVGQPILQVATQVVKNLSSVLQKLTEYAKQATNALSKVFGWDFGKDNSNSAVSDIADSTETLTENLDEADKSAKKLQKNLAGIDKLNVLGKEDTTDDSTNSADIVNATALPTISPEVNTVPMENSVNILTDIFEKLKQKLQPTIDAVKRLWEALKPLKTFTFQALEDFYKDFLQPVGDWLLGKGLPEFFDIVTDLVNSIEWEKLNQSLDGLWKALEPFAENIGDGLLWFLEEVLSPIAEWTINDAIPVFLDTLTATLNGLNSVINSLKQPAKWLMSKLLDPLGKLLSTEFSEISIKIPDGIQKILDKFSEMITALHPFIDWLIDTITPAVLGIAKGISIIIGGILDFLIDVISGIIEALTGIIDFLTGIFTTDWDKVWKGIKEIFGGVFDIIKGIVVGIGETLAGLVVAIGGTVISVLKGAWDIGANLIKGLFKGITDLFGGIGSWIKKHIVDAWINSFKQLFGIHSPSTVMAKIGTFIISGLLDGLKDKFLAVLDWLKSLPEKFKNGFSKVVEGIKQPFLHIADWFKDIFSKAWQKVKDVFSSGGQVFNGIKEGIANVFKTVVNSLIDGINTIIAVPFNNINGLLNTIRSVGIAGIKPFEPFWGENPLPVPQIPKLATGTVIPASYGEFMAILGDNKREPEVVSPISAMKQAFKEAMAEMSFTQNSSGEITVVLELDGNELFRKNVELNQKYKKRHGGRSAFA